MHVDHPLLATYTYWAIFIGGKTSSLQSLVSAGLSSFDMSGYLNLWQPEESTAANDLVDLGSAQCEGETRDNSQTTSRHRKRRAPRR